MVDCELGKKGQKALEPWKEVWILRAHRRVLNRGVSGSDLHFYQAYLATVTEGLRRDFFEHRQVLIVSD